MLVGMHLFIRRTIISAAVSAIDDFLFKSDNSSSTNKLSILGKYCFISSDLIIPKSWISSGCFRGISNFRLISLIQSCNSWYKTLRVFF